jgi:hypothetical protein
VRVDSGGGFVPVQVNLRNLPEFALYGDGTAIVPGAVTMIYPGPAITPLRSFRLSERQVQAVLVRAQRAGLLVRHAIAYGQPPVSDMPTTTLVVRANGRRVVRSAYALGASVGGSGVTPAQAAARRALSRFVASLPRGRAAKPYAPAALAVYAAPYQGTPQAGASRRPWPLASDLATAGRRVSSGLAYRCLTVRGDGARRLLASLRRANEQTRWFVRSHRAGSYQLVVRPLLPDEPSCAALGR